MTTQAKGLKRRLFIRALAISLTASVSTLAVTPALAQNAPPMALNIPAQPASDAVRTLARQTGTQILFDNDRLRRIRSRPVHDVLTARQALRVMLEGSGFEVAETPSGALVIRPTTPGSGEAGAGGVAADNESAREIVVTGTRIEGRGPVGSRLQVYSREEIERRGVGNLPDFFRTIPENFPGSEGVNGSFIFNPDLGSLSSQQGTVVNLRGLGPGATLTLLNGRRIAPAGRAALGADVSLIPIGAIERVDILSDGAASIYGADAVAGVVNLVLRRDFEGVEVSSRYGTSTQGGGDQWQASIAGGTRWQGGSGLIALEHQELETFLTSQRSLPGSSLVPGARFQLAPRGKSNSVFATLNQEISPSLSVSLDGLYSRRTYESDSITGIGGVVTTASQTNGVTWNLGLYGGLRYDLSPTWVIRSDFGFTQTRNRGETISVRPSTGQILVQTPIGDQAKIYSAELSLQGPLFSVGENQVRLAAGAALRRETLAIETAVGVRAFSLDRTVRSAFAEILVPINYGTGIVETSLSARYDDYSKFGSALSPRIGVNWALHETLTLRAAYSRSFRAPTLNQLTDVNSNYFAAGVPDPSFPGGTRPVLIITGQGNSSLEPERSRTFSAGVDYRPSFLPETRISGTFFHIQYSDRIAIPPSPGGTNAAFLPDNLPITQSYILNPAPADLVAAIYATGRVSNGQNIPASAISAIFDSRVTNVAESEYSGIDLSLISAFNIGSVRVAPFATVTHLLKSNFTATPIAPTVSRLNLTYFPVSWRARGGFNYNIGWVSGNITASWIDSYENTYSGQSGVPVAGISSWFTVDTQIAVNVPDGPSTLFSNWQVALSVRNLFDRGPPLVRTPANQPSVGFDPTNANALGRFVSLSFRKRF